MKSGGRFSSGPEQEEHDEADQGRVSTLRQDKANTFSCLYVLSQIDLGETRNHPAPRCEEAG